MFERSRNRNFTPEIYHCEEEVVNGTVRAYFSEGKDAYLTAFDVHLYQICYLSDPQ